jgi:hypothetical protein
LYKTSLRQTKVVLLSLAIVVTMAGLSGCGGGAKQTTTPTKPASTAAPSASAAVTKKAAASSPPKTGAPTVAPKSTTPAAVPKLNDISFPLALEKGQEYTESTTPIFLRANQVLHLNWLVVKGGNHFHLTFSLPSGDAIAVRADGTLAAYSPTGKNPDELTKNGSLVFQPSDNDWEDGYYIFHSQIMSSDSGVSIKLLYWIEG